MSDARAAVARLTPRGVGGVAGLEVSTSDALARLRAGDGPRAERSPLTLEERAHAAAGTAASELGARVLLDQAEGALRDALARAVDADTEERARILATLSAR